jgi:DNA topoisomerase
MGLRGVICQHMLLASAVLPGLRTAQSATAPPPRLTEAALIAAMEAHGIGTDATVAEHIQKQLERRCDGQTAGHAALLMGLRQPVHLQSVTHAAAAVVHLMFCMSSQDQCHRSAALAPFSDRLTSSVY